MLMFCYHNKQNILLCAKLQRCKVKKKKNNEKSNVFGSTCVTTQDVTLLPCEARENVQPEVMEHEIKVG